MRIIKIPPLGDESPELTDDDNQAVDDGSSADVDDAFLRTSPRMGATTVPAGEMNHLYRLMELKLEDIVERLLISKMNESDNLLLNMQTLIERIFVAAAMRMAQGNISRAARLLGINRNTLSKKLRSIDPAG